jgi:site-specific DNA recombinase
MSMSEHQVALYARVSTESQARDNTIASQIAALRERIRADGGQLEPDHAYIDEGYSGSTLVRPALERLRDAVAAGRVERIDPPSNEWTPLIRSDGARKVSDDEEAARIYA